MDKIGITICGCLIFKAAVFAAIASPSIRIYAQMRQPRFAFGKISRRVPVAHQTEFDHFAGMHQCQIAAIQLSCQLKCHCIDIYIAVDRQSRFALQIIG